jgi:PTS system N-acetylglucosamine-specific IIC component
LQVVIGPVADQLAGDIRRHLRAPTPQSADAAALLAALGGAGNIRDVAAASTRLLFAIKDDAAVNETALSAAAPRGFARPSRGSLHVLIGPQAQQTLEQLRIQLAP